MTATAEPMNGLRDIAIRNMASEISLFSEDATPRQLAEAALDALLDLLDEREDSDE